MLKKGWRKAESPEKMPVATAGIEMTRGAGHGALAAKAVERLTGGNAAADESRAAALVCDFIRGKKYRAPKR